MRQPDIARNKAIVLLKKAEPEFYSFAVLANIFNVKREFIHRVYHRDKDKYHLPSESVVK